MAKILLVDDDPFQAFVRKSTLETRFQDVERVSDAAEALCLVEQPQSALGIALVITGLQRPGIGGPAFVAELHSRLPKVPVLVLGSASEVAGDYAAEGVRFLSRPFASEEILTVASQMLTRNGH